MNIIIEPALRDYMKQKGKQVIVVEIAQSDSSDFEVTELYIHLANEKQAAFYKEKKNYRSRLTEGGEVLLPNYRLEYEETIVFHLKKYWFIHMIGQTGISF